MKNPKDSINFGMFSGTGAASTGSSNYLRAGDYVVRIDKCHTFESRKKNKLAAIDMTILHVLEEGNDDSKPHMVGEPVNWCVKFGSDFFLPNLKQFCQAVLGMDSSNEENEYDEALEEVFGAENPLAGTCIQIQGIPQMSKEGNPYIKNVFRKAFSFTEIAEILPADQISRFFPDDTLEKLIAEEEKA